jgi:type IV pilus assembly protein PilP
MRNLTGMLVLGSALCLVAACEDSKPAPAPAPKPKAKPAPVAEAPAVSADGGTVAAEAAAPYVYAYNPVAKRDPYRVLFENAPDRKEGDPVPTCTEPLCQFDLDQLTLVAVISGDANPVAMLEDAAQVGHIVRRNTKVGKQGGKVTQILRDCIVITEYFTTPDGKLNPNRVNICVKQEKSQNQVMDLLNNKQIE